MLADGSRCKAIRCAYETYDIEERVMSMNCMTKRLMLYELVGLVRQVELSPD